MATALASRYATALADLVLKPGAEVGPAEAAAQIKAFEKACESSPELKLVLLSPAVPGTRKRAVISHLAGPLGLSNLVRNFLYVVVDRRRIEEIARIREAFEAAVDERMGVVKADVTSAQEMNDAQRNALQAELSRLTRKQVRASYSVDPALLGGAIARTGSIIYDGSVKGQLEALRHRLKSD
jgi:F-type H+-transporting ATPase subunit delta